MNFFSSRSPACALRVASVLLALVLSPLLSRAAGVGLQPFNVDISQTSVSGLSSGGYMAVQLEVAYSSIVKGVGVIAAGPYFCAQGRTDIATTVCSCTALLPTLCKAGSNARDVPALIKITDQYALDGKIETTSSLASHKIFLFSAIRDTKVPRRVMNDLGT